MGRLRRRAGLAGSMHRQVTSRGLHVVTVIVGIETDDGVVLGADRSCTWPDLNQIATYSYPKLFEYGPFLIGGCGSPRSMDLLRGCGAGDDWKPERAVHYLANAYRKALIDGGG